MKKSKQNRTLWLAVSIGAFVLWIASTIFVRNATILAFAYVSCITVLLFALPRAWKKKPKKRKKETSKHDPYRLLPQDKGKIIQFPKK